MGGFFMEKKRFLKQKKQEYLQQIASGKELSAPLSPESLPLVKGLSCAAVVALALASQDVRSK
jgi:hypothetical protein